MKKGTGSELIGVQPSQSPERKRRVGCKNLAPGVVPVPSLPEQNRAAGGMESRSIGSPRELPDPAERPAISLLSGKEGVEVGEVVQVDVLAFVGVEEA